jgi:hypothetical protein
VVFLRSRKSDNCGRVGAEHQEARDDAILNDGGIRVKRFHHLGSDDLSCIADASAYIDGICGERLNPAEGILLYVGDEESSKSVGMCLLAMHLARHHSFTGDEAVSFLRHCNNMLRSGGSCWVHTLAKLLSTSPGQDQGQGLRPAGPWIPCGPSDVWALGCAGVAKIRMRGGYKHVWARDCGWATANVRSTHARCASTRGMTQDSNPARTNEEEFNKCLV